MTPKKQQLLGILAVFLCVVAADQIAKTIIMHVYPAPGLHRPGPGPVFFHFTHQRNPGLVGGLFNTRPVLARVAPLLASLVLLYLYRYLDKTSKLQTLAFGLIAGGAVSNIIDRVRLGSVTDFLQFHFYFIPFNFPWKHYPAFNIADSCICVGVFLLVVGWYFMEQQHAANTV
ncbi:MAG: signal peptidase II [Nitrospiraceae bacterium]|nr:signal peptidase II [Nitrospiraceae bacterium]